MRWQYGGGRATVDRAADRKALREAGFSDEQIGQMLPVAADEAPPAIELLEENLPVWKLWCSLRTQWRTGVAGATGLDYGVLTPAYYRQFGFKGGAVAEAFERLQAMEAEVLTIMDEKS